MEETDEYTAVLTDGEGEGFSTVSVESLPFRWSAVSVFSGRNRLETRKYLRIRLQIVCLSVSYSITCLLANIRVAQYGSSCGRRSRIGLLDDVSRF